MIPEFMTAIEIVQPGPPEVLVPATRPVPVPGDGDVLIKVAAAGVNRPDVMQRLGQYPPPAGASDIPGLEVAGPIVACGPGVARWHEGDSVCVLVTGGGYADYCLAPAVLCLPIPTGLDATAAAAMPETFFTVWTNVFDRGHLQPGETLLVHGGASGIGTTAIQMAVALGARVVVTAGSPAKCDACRGLGAELAVDYRQEDFVEAIKAHTDGRGVDVILDMVGGDYFPRNVAVLAEEGRLVQIAIQHGPKTELNLWRIMQRRLTLTGSTLRSRPVSEKRAIAERLEARVWPLVAEGRIRPVVHETFPLARAADAHAALEAGQHIGKIVLVNAL